MSNIFLARLTTCIVAMAFTCSIRSQQSDTAFTYTYHPPVKTNLFATNSRKSFLENSRFTEISLKAVRHFIKSFEQAENVHWYKTDDGVVAYFTANGIKTRAAYDKKGNWLYKIRSYGEAYLPKDVREQIKSMFYDFSITCVNEITNSRQLAYFVQIEDRTSLKTIRVWEGELVVDKEFVKQ